MARGRIAKPTALKALQGNAGHRTDDRGNEPAPPAGAPEPPAWLGKIAQQAWFDMCAQMMVVPGWLTKFDGHTMTLYCAAWETYVDAKIRIPRLEAQRSKVKSQKKRGQLLNEINLLKGERKQAAKELVTHGDRLGTSPAARTRIRVSTGQGELPLGGAAENESPFARAQSLAHGA